MHPTQADALLPLDFPAGQASHVAASWLLQRPAGQGSQVIAAEVLHDPAEQAVHVAKNVSLLNLPAGHGCKM